MRLKWRVSAAFAAAISFPSTVRESGGSPKPMGLYCASSLAYRSDYRHAPTKQPVVYVRLIFAYTLLMPTRKLAPVQVLERLLTRLEKRMEALQRVTLDGFQMVISELEVEQDYLRRAKRYLEE
jgi:hypothetical protein